MFGMGAFGSVIALIIAVLFIVGWWKIFSRVGYSGIMGLLMVIPVVNLIAFLWLAFAPWPIEDANELSRSSEQA